MGGRWHGMSSYVASLFIVVVAFALPVHAGFVTFETGQVRPLALSPDGTRLFAINTPDGRLEVFDVDANGDLSHAASVPVGMEPIAVAALSNDEVWVVNHLSDSISIVDVNASPARVVRTLLVGDEPRDIVVANTVNGPRVFVTTAHRGQNTPLHINIETDLRTAGQGRADVWVFDPSDLGATLEGTPQTILTFLGDTPAHWRFPPTVARCTRPCSTPAIRPPRSRKARYATAEPAPGHARSTTASPFPTECRAARCRADCLRPTRTSPLIRDPRWVSS